MKTKKGNVLYRLFFNRKDERSYGRFAFFFDSLMNNFASIFASGAFYTAFLRLNDISMSDVGVMTYMPIIANISCIFAPFIFRNMKKRKAVLMAARIAYYLVNLVGVALVPILIRDAGVRVALMAFFLSFANVIWGLFVGGFADWELNFLPQDGTREDYYAYGGLICSIVSSVTSILAGFAATALEATSPQTQNTWLFWLRIGGFAFILLDVLVFLRAKEYPYPPSDVHLKLKDIFVVPIKNKPFRRVMLLHTMISMGAAITGSSWTYYLMDLGLGYSTLSFLSSITPIMALILTPIALRFFKKMGCVNNIFLYRFIDIFVCLGYVFVVPATVRWLYPIIFVFAQLVTVGVNVANFNFIYMFMPEKDRLTYYSFYYSTATVMSFVGSFFGAQFITRTQGRVFSLLGIRFAPVQMLMLIQTLIFAVIVCIFASFRRSLNEEEKILTKI
jgi:Na+/melibiose symporter-like transporter